MSAPGHPAPHAPTPVPSTVILASAGTGKTYQLTGRFIRLLAMGVSPGAILATTFTRKAAGEILGRVLTRLASAALDPSECRALASAIEHPLDPGRAALLLRGVVDELPKIAVMTIDAFFARLVAAYALELDLPPGWRIGDPVQLGELIDAALLNCLEAMDDASRTDLLRELHEGGYGREVVPTLAKVREEATAAWRECRGDLAPWGAIQPAYPPLEPGAWALLASRLESAPVAQTKAGKDHASWRTAHTKLMDLVRRQDWPGILKSGLLGAMFKDTYYGLTMPAPTGDALLALGRHASARMIERLSMRNRAYGRAAGAIDAAVSQEKLRRGIVEFDDLPRRLLERPFEGQLDHLYYRLDARLEHVLLDEFQDTSADQFSLLRPLLEEILADAEAGPSGLPRSVFVVGDVKQSLYQWRGASPEILGTLADTLPGLGTPSTLSESWRSSAVVLDTVNRALQGVGSNAAVQALASGAVSEAALRWDQRFPAHVARKGLLGEASLLVAESRDDADLVARAVARAQEIRARSSEVGIAVLVRRRKLIPWLVRDLLNAGLDASQEGGNPLTDTPAVAAFVSLLHLADQPADTIAWLHLSSTPWARALGLDAGAFSADARSAVRASEIIRAALVSDGAAGLLARLVRYVAPETSAPSLRRLEQLALLLDRAEASGPRSPRELVRFIRETPVEAPSAARVRVMTIHQSKGLEFDAVILPELHLPWGVGRGPMVWRDGGEVRAVSLPGNAELRRWHATLAQMHERQRATEFSSELCVLYVAMTRARHALYMIVPPEGKSGESTTCSAGRLLCHALAPGRALVPGAELWRHDASDSAWTTEVRAPGDVGPAPVQVDPSKATLHAADRPSAAVAPPPSTHEREDGPELVLPSGSRRRGTAGHRAMELIAWLDERQPPSAEIASVLAALGLDTATRSELERQIAGWMVDPQVLETLSRNPCAARLAGLGRTPVEPTQLRLRREWMFATRDAQGRILRGQIDRLVTAHDGAGAVIAAEIIDYKTDPAPADANAVSAWREGRIQTYRSQMDAYRRSASRALRISPDRIGVRLLMLGARPGERVAEV